MRKIKWGILGCASIAEKSVIPAIKQAENSELYALASRSLAKAEDFADRFGGKQVYDDYQKLLEDEKVEAVYIALPNKYHRHWVIEAARHKKHILCEKPLALHAREVEEMIRAAEDHGVLLMEAFMYRFHPLVKGIKELADSGVIGKLNYIDANFCYNSSRPEGDIRFNPQLGGGALYDIGCYTVNFVRYIAGEEPVEVFNTTVERPGSGVDNSGAAVLRFAGGMLANLKYSFASADLRGIKIIGTEGKINSPDFFSWKGTEDRKFFLEKEDSRKVINVLGREQYLLEVKEFASAILTNSKTVPLDVKDAYANLQVMDAMRLSADRGEVISLAGVESTKR